MRHLAASFGNALTVVVVCIGLCRGDVSGCDWLVLTLAFLGDALYELVVAPHDDRGRGEIIDHVHHYDEPRPQSVGSKTSRQQC